MDQKIVEDFYSSQAKMRLKFFIDGNARIEKAWETLISNVYGNPQNILEIGCSIGTICWRMALNWPNAQVIGLDLTKDYIEIGNRLFATPNLRLLHGTMPYSFSSKFQLIVLMDVYEHIANEDRLRFNLAIKDSLASDGLVFLSYPTPRIHDYLREHSPDEMQPVDERITMDVVIELAEMLNKDILLYKEISVYYTGDYAHVVLGSHGECERLQRPTASSKRKKFYFFRLRKEPVWLNKKYRKNLVQSRLLQP